MRAGLGARARAGLGLGLGLHAETSARIAFIGGGRMADAMLGAFQTRKTVAMDNVTLYDVNPSAREYMSSKYGIRTHGSIHEAIRDVDMAVLAVKPQHVKHVGEALPQGLGKDTLLLSIVAGWTTDALSSMFNTQLVVRSMPNTPATIGEGITLWYPTPPVSNEARELVQALLTTLGEEVFVEDELYIDMGTALSGSGPAYVFLVMESLVEAGVHMGFPREIAMKLVLQTIKGSAQYAQQGKEGLPQLRNNVTSPGGTTAAALYALEKGGLRTVVADAIWAAYRRALELGGKPSNVGPGRNKLS